MDGRSASLYKTLSAANIRTIFLFINTNGIKKNAHPLFKDTKKQGEWQAKCPVYRGCKEVY